METPFLVLLGVELLQSAQLHQRAAAIDLFARHLYPFRYVAAKPGHHEPAGRIHQRKIPLRTLNFAGEYSFQISGVFGCVTAAKLVRATMREC